MNACPRCQNGARCSAASKSGITPPQYRCMCRAGYVGVNCQRKYRPQPRYKNLLPLNHRCTTTITRRGAPKKCQNGLYVRPPSAVYSDAVPRCPFSLIVEYLGRLECLNASCALSACSVTLPTKDILSMMRQTRVYVRKKLVVGNQMAHSARTRPCSCARQCAQRSTVQTASARCEVETAATSNAAKRVRYN